MPSFAVKVPNLMQLGPTCEILIGVSGTYLDFLNQKKLVVPSPIRVTAMIDTGASGTVIHPDIPKALGISPVGAIAINTPSSSNFYCNQFNVGILFPSNVVYSECIAIEAPLTGQHIKCLIGRDILSQAVFIYTGFTETYSLSF